MSKSLTDITLHLVFSTKERRPLLDEECDSLHNFMRGLAINLECPIVAINNVNDHIHILFHLSKNIALKEFIMKLKANSSRWLKSYNSRNYDFAWQKGYGCFSISRSNILKVTKYISTQKERHKTQTFKEEFLEMLKLANQDLSEKYLWE